MKLEMHRAMRREQIERWLATEDMTLTEWCKLNHMATSTFYLWLNKFREEEPEVFGERPAKGWIEVAKQNRKDSVALAVSGSTGTLVPAGTKKKEPEIPVCTRFEPITISTSSATISIPAGSNAADIANVIQAVMHL